MSKKDVHVTPRLAGGWGVGRAGGQRQSSLYNIQAAAAAEGRCLAGQDSVEFYLHGRNGQIREKDSYGHDPNPAKG